jgi:hypothetical protein
MMIGWGFVTDGHMNRLKSLFVHKMQNIGGHSPIVEVLETAGVDVCEKVTVRGHEVVTPTPTTSEVDIDSMITASTPEHPPTPLSTTTTTATTDTYVTTSTDGKDMDLGFTTPTRMAEPFGSEPLTPIIVDVAEWMVRRHQSLVRIEQKREARRRGGAART